MSQVNGRGKKALRSVVFGVAFSLALAAVAFFLATWLGDGSHEGTTGKGAEESLPILVDFADGVTPVNPVEVTAELENTSGAVRTFDSFTMGVETPTVPACEAWLTITVKAPGSMEAQREWWQGTIDGTERPGEIGGYGQGTVPIASAQVENGDDMTFWLEFTETGVDQSACEEVPVIVSGHLE